MAHVLSWARFYGSLLGLQDWMITIKLDSLAPGILATTYAHPGQRQAHVLLDTIGLRHEGEPQKVVLHELLHIVTGQAHTLALQAAGSNPESRALVGFAFEDLVQRMTGWRFWPTPPKEVRTK